MTCARHLIKPSRSRMSGWRLRPEDAPAISSGPKKAHNDGFASQVGSEVSFLGIPDGRQPGRLYIAQEKADSENYQQTAFVYARGTARSSLWVVNGRSVAKRNHFLRQSQSRKTGTG